MRAAFLLVDNAAFTDMEKRLQTASGAQRPFRHSARELLALSAFKAGDVQGLRRWADMINGDAETPAAMRAPRRGAACFVKRRQAGRTWPCDAVFSLCPCSA